MLSVVTGFILVFFYSNAGMVQIVHPWNYSTLESCQAAGKMAKENAGLPLGLGYMCVPTPSEIEK